MAKLTLNVDADVVSRAKKYAKARGLSLPQLVEAYLAAVPDPESLAVSDTPVLRSVRGILKTADTHAYKRRLAMKHR